MSRRDYAITRRGDTINYTVKDVEEADEDEVFDIGEDLEVDLSGLTDMDGIRQRIIMHIEKVKGNYKDQVGRLACCQLHHRCRKLGAGGDLAPPPPIPPPSFFCKVSPLLFIASDSTVHWSGVRMYNLCNY